MTNEHPFELIPGFVLGALDPEEEGRVRRHLLQCPICRGELDTFSASLTRGGPALGAPVPPPHVKQRLLARILESQEPPAAEVAPARPPRARPAVLRPLASLTLGLALLALIMLLVIPRRPQPDPIASGECSLAVFAAAPGTVAHTIPDQAAPAGVRTILYTHSGDTRVGMRVENLAPAPHGHTYQLWVASSAGQFSLGTFDPGQDGGVSMLAVAPTSIDQYTDAMVTIEPTGGAASPSEKVVWQIRL